MLIIVEESDSPASDAIVARDVEGCEHELAVVARAGMVCIQNQEQESAYVMHAAAALRLGLRLIQACAALDAAGRGCPARRGRQAREGTH